MNATLSAALRMPHQASVAAPAPLVLGVPAEPCAMHSWRTGGIIAPASAGRLGGSDGSDRFGGGTRSIVGVRWYRQDQAQLAGGGPLRG